jgi:hypothetical protein
MTLHELYGHNRPGRRRIRMASLLTANSRRSARACAVTSRSSPRPACRAYSDSYLNDNWILVR